MRLSVYLIGILISVFIINGMALAGLSVGAHAGYGYIKYSESTDKLGDQMDSDVTLDTFITGVSVEYSFEKLKKIYVSFITDWVFGLEDREEWESDHTLYQTNDLTIFGQFYDGRLGYKSEINRLYYTLYISGGWDGFHFRRTKFRINGSRSDDVITEDFSLWRAGGGMSIGYSFGQISIDSRIAYAYYFDGEVRNSSHSGLVYDTNGTCLDLGLGISFKIDQRWNIYAGWSYSLIRLDESEPQRDDSLLTIFPYSKTKIMAGMFNLGYSF